VNDMMPNGCVIGRPEQVRTRQSKARIAVGIVAVLGAPFVSRNAGQVHAVTERRREEGSSVSAFVNAPRCKRSGDRSI